MAGWLFIFVDTYYLVCYAGSRFFSRLRADYGDGDETSICLDTDGVGRLCSVILLFCRNTNSARAQPFEASFLTVMTREVANGSEMDQTAKSTYKWEFSLTRQVLSPLRLAW